MLFSNKASISLFVFILLVCSCAPKRTCEDYSNGQFRINDWDNDLSYWIMRTDSIQIETKEGTGDTSKYIVTWLDPCEYKLELIEGNQEMMAFFKGRPLNVEILEVLQNGYQYKSYFEGTEMVFYQNLTKID